MFSIDRHNVPAKSRLYMLSCILYQVEILYSISPNTVQCTYIYPRILYCTMYVHTVYVSPNTVLYIPELGRTLSHKLSYVVML